MRVAAIDIGTNTVLLLVAEHDSSGELKAVEERATITRLGEGVDRTRTLAPAAIARTNACLDEYARIITQAGAERVAVVGTSAMRDAGGSGAVRDHVERVLGVEARVIGGDEEARLTFIGAQGGLHELTRTARKCGQGARDEVAVFDVGGGSTEVVIGRLEQATAKIVFARSYDVGSVRLTERHVRSDPPSAAEIDTIKHETRATFANVPPLPSSAPPIGIAGTMTTLAAVSLGLVPYDGARVHGHRMSHAELERVVTHLASLDLSSRASVAGLEPKRADVIIAGGIIALALLEHWKTDTVIVSDRGVRWGIAEELARNLSQRPQA
jgi:exopolyphosphatase/guanosine-5'-triphosphate,3'-diphosphate pyrophosphatase